MLLVNTRLMHHHNTEVTTRMGVLDLNQLSPHSLLAKRQLPLLMGSRVVGLRVPDFGPRWLTCVLLASTALTSGASNTGFSSGILTGTSIQLSTSTRPLSFSLSYTSSSGVEASGTGTSSAAGIVPSSSGLTVTTM